MISRTTQRTHHNNTNKVKYVKHTFGMDALFYFTFIPQIVTFAYALYIGPLIDRLGIQKLVLVLTIVLDTAIFPVMLNVKTVGTLFYFGLYLFFYYFNYYSHG